MSTEKNQVSDPAEIVQFAEATDFGPFSIANIP